MAVDDGKKSLAETKHKIHMKAITEHIWTTQQVVCSRLATRASHSQLLYILKQAHSTEFQTKSGRSFKSPKYVIVSRHFRNVDWKKMRATITIRADMKRPSISFTKIRSFTRYRARGPERLIPSGPALLLWKHRNLKTSVLGLLLRPKSVNYILFFVENQQSKLTEVEACADWQRSILTIRDRRSCGISTDHCLRLCSTSNLVET